MVVGSEKERRAGAMRRKQHDATLDDRNSSARLLTSHLKILILLKGHLRTTEVIGHSQCTCCPSSPSA